MDLPVNKLFLVIKAMSSIPLKLKMAISDTSRIVIPRTKRSTMIFLFQRVEIVANTPFQ